MSSTNEYPWPKSLFKNYELIEDTPVDVQTNKDYFEELSKKLQPGTTRDCSVWKERYNCISDHLYYREYIRIDKMIKGEYYHLTAHHAFLYYSLSRKYYLIYQNYGSNKIIAYELIDIQELFQFTMKIGECEMNFT
jgi:hypothetical protein